jgi:hypothetical protein
MNRERKECPDEERRERIRRQRTIRDLYNECHMRDGGHRAGWTVRRHHGQPGPVVPTRDNKVNSQALPPFHVAALPRWHQACTWHRDTTRNRGETGDQRWSTTIIAARWLLSNGDQRSAAQTIKSSKEGKSNEQWNHSSKERRWIGSFRQKRTYQNGSAAQSASLQRRSLLWSCVGETVGRRSDVSGPGLRIVGAEVHCTKVWCGQGSQLVASPALGRSEDPC